MTVEKWYRDGVKFSCTGCGNCCSDHGEYTYVYLVQQDIETIAPFFKMTQKEFLEKYCIQDDELTYLRMNGSDCPFLQEGKCNVYEVRPKQCRTWPFWLENLNKETWDNEVVPCCPGIGQGEFFSAEQIQHIAIQSEEGF